MIFIFTDDSFKYNPISSELREVARHVVHLTTKTKPLLKRNLNQLATIKSNIEVFQLIKIIKSRQ
jgi:hypothetical protein